MPPSDNAPPPAPSTTVIETSRHYPPHILRAFEEAKGKRLSMPG
jgi:hypothetical protein